MPAPTQDQNLNAAAEMPLLQPFCSLKARDEYNGGNKMARFCTAWVFRTKVSGFFRFDFIQICNHHQYLIRLVDIPWYLNIHTNKIIVDKVYLGEHFDARLTSIIEDESIPDDYTHSVL